MFRLFIVIFVVFFSTSSVAQTNINKGRRVCVDGKIEQGEWCDSKILLFDTSIYVTSKVFLKHDGSNLLIAYINEKIMDTTYLFPEILIDSKLNRGDLWQPDDYWFHVSAQDCYARGERENYDNCRPDYTVWQASPNHPFGVSYEPIGVFEIAIPFELLGIKTGDKIGICFSQVLMPYEIRLCYPKSAHENIPNTWGEFYIIDSPEKFAPGIVSKDERWEVSLAFTPDQKQMFYTVKYPDEEMRIFSRKFRSDKWDKEFEVNLLVSPGASYAMEPFVSPDGLRLYYTVCDTSGNCDIWFAEKSGYKWLNPKKLNSKLNDDVVFYSTFYQNGDMLYTNVSKMKTCLAKYDSGEYSHYDEAGIGGAHAYPSPCGGFVLVNSSGKYGRSDLFVYFKQDDGSWSNPINLGAVVNTECSESCPSLSPDGKYLYFNRYCSDDEYDVFEIDAAFINQLKPAKK